MSATSHKTDFFILALLGIVSSAILLAFLTWSSFGKNPQEDDWLRTSFSTNVHGTRVYYTLLETLGYRVQRLQSSLLSDNLNNVDLLLMLDPPVPLGEGERLELEQWVRLGGILICNSKIDHRLRALSVSPPRSGEAKDRKKAEPQNTPSQIPPRDAGLPLAADLAEVQFTTTDILEDKSPETRPAEVKPSRERLFADSLGLRLAGRSFGSGKIIVYSDSSFLSNGLIGFHDNSILAINLIAYTLTRSKGSRIAFDETHFDFDRQETGWPVLAGLLVNTSPGWAVLCLTAAGILYLIYKGRRFGSRSSLHRPRRRSKLEFIYSVAATYQSAGAHRLAFGLIYRSFKHQAARSVGLPESTPADQIAAELARRAAKPRNTYQLIFENCEKVANPDPPKLSARQVLPLLDQLKTIELEAIHGTATRK
jgi:hypothetical protein